MSWLKEKLQVENIDPKDPVLLLSPGIVKEHVARYEYALREISNLTNEGSLVVADLASGRGYGVEKTECDHPDQDRRNH